MYSQGSLKEGEGARRDSEEDTTMEERPQRHEVAWREGTDCQGCEQPCLEAGNGKETDPPLKPAEQNSTLLIAYLDFQAWETSVDFLTYRNLNCKPVGLLERQQKTNTKGLIFKQKL